MSVKDIDGYTLVRSLGKGGMGEVYEVRTAEGAHLALKSFVNEGEHTDFLRKRFLAEGRLLFRLEHPRLVKVRQIAVDGASGRPYFTMDLVLGPTGKPQTLEDVRCGLSLDEPRIARYYVDLRDGLVYLHAQGIVHRDVKLENVLVDADGHAVLSDFGISRIFDEKLRRDIAVTTTMAGEKAPIMGSFGYLAPELKRGEPATPASDSYALGVLIFRLLTGVWYEADSTARDLLAGFDPAWTELLARLLNEDPTKRLPMPEKVALGTIRKRRTIVGRIVAVASIAVVVASVFAYVRMRPPHYDFDDFFPPESQVVNPSQTSQPFFP